MALGAVSDIKLQSNGNFLVGANLVFARPHRANTRFAPAVQCLLIAKWYETSGNHVRGQVPGTPDPTSRRPVPIQDLAHPLEQAEDLHGLLDEVYARVQDAVVDDGVGSIARHVEHLDRRT